MPLMCKFNYAMCNYIVPLRYAEKQIHVMKWLTSNIASFYVYIWGILKNIKNSIMT